MNRAVVLLLAPCLFLPAASAATPTTDPLEQKLAAQKEHEKQEYLRQLDDSQELKLPHNAITDIFDLTIDDAGMLSVRPKIHATDGPMRCSIKGLAGPCSVTAFADKSDPAGRLIALQFTHRDFSNEEEIFRNTMLFAHQGSVQLSTDLDGLIQGRDVSVVQTLNPDPADSSVELYAQLSDPITDATIAKCNLSAPNFRELRLRYPRQTQEFVVPILRDLEGQSILAPDPRVAYQVFQTQFTPNARLSRQIDAALEKLDADDFQTRQQASRDLAALGEPAALALMHADRKGWSIDRSSGVDNFLAQYKALPPDQIQKLKNNPAFLLDCLYSNDPQIRDDAAKSLNGMLKQRIDFPTPGPALDQAIDRAAATLLPPIATMPATQP